MITFKVGDKEQHEVSFSYDSTWGRVKILVDNKEQASSVVMLVGHTPFTFQVGDKEKHVVRIELENPFGFAFRGSDVKVFIDEQVFKQEHIGGNIKSLLIAFFIIMLMATIGISLPYLLSR